MRCNRCYRPMTGTTAYDGACECGGLIEATPASNDLIREIETGRFYIVDEVLCAGGVWAHVLGKSDTLQKYLLGGEVELIMHKESR